MPRHARRRATPPQTTFQLYQDAFHTRAASGASSRALRGNPVVILADATRLALEPALRQDFMDVLMQAARDAGSTLVCVGHDPQQAARFDQQWSLPDLQQAGAQA